MHRGWHRFLLACTLGAISAGAAAAQGYSGHPRLLFASNDVPGLRTKLADGGDDDVVYVALRSWSTGVLGASAAALLSSWEGVHSVPQLGLCAQVEVDGSAYAAKCREVVLYLARNRGPTNDEFASASRLFSLALGYDLAFAGATPAEQAEVRDEMRGYLDYMPPRFNYYSGAYNPYAGNHGMTVGAAAGLAVVAMWDDVAPSAHDSLQAALDFADLLVQKCLDDILGSDGSYKEGVLYAGWIVRMAAPYLEARSRFDGETFGADLRLRRMADWLCYEVLPEGGGRTNNLNDSPWSSRPLALHTTYLAWAQTRYASPLAKYLYRHVAGTFGYDHGQFADRAATALWAQPLPDVDPGSLLPAGRLFADRGIYFYRSGWKSGATGDEILFSFYSGKFYGSHAQEDQNQFTLAAYGERFAVDNGAVGASITPKQTEAHNLVRIDGLGQHNAGNSIGTDGRIAASLLSRCADYLRGDAKAAYDTYSPFNAAGVPFTFSDWSWGYDGGNPVLRADRTCLVVRGAGAPPWILLADDIEKDGSLHTYDWTLHTLQTHLVDTNANPILVQGAQASLQVYFAAPQAPALTVAAAPFTHGGVDPATTRIVASVQAVAPRFCVALVPLATGMPAPAYAAESLGTATRLVLDWGGVRDVVVSNPASESVTGEIETDARLAYVRAALGVTGYLLGEGRSLHYSGLELVTFWGGMASAALAADSLHLSNQDLGFRAWAPSAQHVVGPDGPISFERHGDYVQSPGVSDTRGGGGAGAARFLAVSGTPVRASAEIRFGLDSDMHVRLRIADARGRIVATLADGRLPRGDHRLTWHVIEAGGRRLAPGVYLAVLEAPGARLTRKLVVLR